MRAPSTPGAALAALAILVFGACNGGETPPEASRFASGVVLALDDQGIEAHEIDAASVYVERISPSAGPAHLRRLALTNIVLPRHVARRLDPAAHAKAKADAESLHGALVAGTFTGPARPDGTIGELLEGGWGELGLVAWGEAMDLPEGQWSGVLEEVGAFVVLRRLGKTEAEVPMATTVKIEAFLFHWLDPETVHQRVDSAYDGHRLTVVDPAWAEIPPTLLLHRMQGKKKP